MINTVAENVITLAKRVKTTAEIDVTQFMQLVTLFITDCFNLIPPVSKTGHGVSLSHVSDFLSTNVDILPLPVLLSFQRALQQSTPKPGLKSALISLNAKLPGISTTNEDAKVRESAAMLMALTTHIDFDCYWVLRNIVDSPDSNPTEKAYAADAIITVLLFSTVQPKDSLGLGEVKYPHNAGTLGMKSQYIEPVLQRLSLTQLPQDCDVVLVKSIFRGITKLCKHLSSSNVALLTQTFVDVLNRIFSDPKATLFWAVHSSVEMTDLMDLVSELQPVVFLSSLNVTTTSDENSDWSSPLAKSLKPTVAFGNQVLAQLSAALQLLRERIVDLAVTQEDAGRAACGLFNSAAAIRNAMSSFIGDNQFNRQIAETETMWWLWRGLQSITYIRATGYGNESTGTEFFPGGYTIVNSKRKTTIIEKWLTVIYVVLLARHGQGLKALLRLIAAIFDVDDSGKNQFVVG